VIRGPADNPRGCKLNPYDPAALAARLPDELRSFRPSTDPADFRQHLRAVGDFAGSDDLAMPVMNAAGLSGADWYRQALGSRRS
jgi:hypothetical protein